MRKRVADVRQQLEDHRRGSSALRLGIIIDVDGGTMNGRFFKVIHAEQQTDVVCVTLGRMDHSLAVVANLQHSELQIDTYSTWLLFVRFDSSSSPYIFASFRCFFRSKRSSEPIVELFSSGQEKIGNATRPDYTCSCLSFS